MFDDPTRVAIQKNLLEFGNALAGRGVDLNEAIGQLKPLVQLLTPVMKNLADPNTGLSNFVSSLSATAAEVAPVAQIQGQLFVDLDTTFGAFARVARPFIQESISKGPAAEDTAIATLPTVRPFLANTTKLFAELRPGFRAIAPVQKDLGNSIVERRQGPGPRARPERPARPDGAVPAQPLEQRAGAARSPVPDPVQHHARPAAQLHHAGAVRLQLRLDPVQQRRQPRQLQRRGRERPALHRAAAPARRGQRDRPELRAGQRPGRPAHQLPPLQPLPEHRLAGPDARVRGGQRGLSGQDSRSGTSRAIRASTPPARSSSRSRSRASQEEEEGQEVTPDARPTPPPSPQPKDYDERIYRKGNPPHRVRNALILIVLVIIGTYLAVDEVDPLPVPLRAPRGLQERGQHPQGLAGPDRRRQRRQGREHQERLRQRSDRQLRQQLLGCDLHRRRQTVSRSTATPRSRSGRASSSRATSSST